MEVFMKLLAALAFLAAVHGQEPPTEVRSAMKKLEASPDDSAANLSVGLYLLAQKDERWLAHVGKCSDRDVRKAFDEEIEALKGDKYVNWSATGDAWLTAAKKLKKPVLQEHGVECLARAWERADASDKVVMRVRLSKIAAPPDGYEKAGPPGSPAGWSPFEAPWGASVDSRFARTGRCSVKLLPVKEYSSAESLKIPVIPGKPCVLSAWVFAQDVDQAGDLNLSFRDASGKKLDKPSVIVPGDSPFWRRIEVRCEVPAQAAWVLVRLDIKFTHGAIWMDDVSVALDGKDIFSSSLEK
jgi:hypothetical protein